jgi:hypothetical protein
VTVGVLSCFGGILGAATDSECESRVTKAAAQFGRAPWQLRSSPGGGPWPSWLLSLYAHRLLPLCAVEGWSVHVRRRIQNLVAGSAR